MLCHLGLGYVRVRVRYVRVRVRYDRVTFDGSTLRPAGLCYG